MIRKHKIVIFLFFIALAIRLIGIDEHGLFHDELSWMVRGKELFFAVKQFNLNFFESGWWLNRFAAEPLGLPMAFLAGIMLVVFSPGQSRLSLGIIPDIIAARIPVVIIGSLFIPVYYLLIRKYIDKKIALVAALLMVFDPVSLGLSRWLHQDLALAATSFISLLLFIRNRSGMTLLASAVFASLALLTKPQGFLIPISLFIYCLSVSRLERKTFFTKLGKWLFMVGCLVIIAFPFLWRNPLTQMLLYLKTQLSVVSQGHLVYFLGQITRNPPWYYYLAITPFHLTEAVLLGVIAGLIGVFVSFKKRFFKLSPLAKISLIYSLLAFLTVSLASKKLGIRYLFPLWPYILLFAGWGLFTLSNLFTTNFRKVFWFFIFAFTIIEVLRFYPSYYLFHNHLISARQYQEMELVGVCDGIKPAMEYLAPLINEGSKIMFLTCGATANYYTGYSLKIVEDIKEEPEYIILEKNYAQRFPQTISSIEENNYQLLKEIDFRGISLVTIYRQPVL